MISKVSPSLRLDNTFKFAYTCKISGVVDNPKILSPVNRLSAGVDVELPVDVQIEP